MMQDGSLPPQTLLAIVYWIVTALMAGGISLWCTFVRLAPLRPSQQVKPRFIAYILFGLFLCVNVIPILLSAGIPLQNLLCLLFLFLITDAVKGVMEYFNYKRLRNEETREIPTV